ncbi:ArsR family transcriptional regulator [Haladaptatus pallidirubidus]|uniref:DUF7344 domain-containing protein n=1 Tax=Haladaptatus pallidirubidus TaxID=1008152 RepID=A0AAV3UN94_9EURY|nr:ArsR family transcriptional regulator [Haladaptatus pallidirubidus]
MNSDVRDHETTGSVSTDDPLSHASLDTVLNSLANSYRRRLLFALLEHNPQDDDSQIPADIEYENEDLESLKICMTHTHLPKLDDTGFIKWNRETNTVQKGPRFDEIQPLLKLMHNHADELPDKWL